jgi:hypothetical protein
VMMMWHPKCQNHPLELAEELVEKWMESVALVLVTNWD